MGSDVGEPLGGPRQRPAVLSRRGTLRLGAAGVASFLAACAEPEQAQAPAPSRGASADGAASATTRGTSDAEATPTDAEATATEATTSTPTAAAVPSREDIVSRYAGQAPTAFGLEVPGIVLRHPGRGVALTFDLCGGPQGDSLDQDLWDLLRQHAIASTFFVNSRWLRANPSLARELGADPLIEIANHGHEHRPLTVDGRAAYGIRGTPDVGAAYDEVAAPVLALTELGGPPLWFRSGTAHCDDVGVSIAEALGQRVVNFSINGDAGATFTPEQVATEVGRAGDGDIVIAHANQPGSGTAAGLALALPDMLDRGVTFVRLADVLPSPRGVP